MLTDYDVVVIGGGVQGCGIAQASAAAGYQTLIIEKNSWGSGTSSKSSKLIHGGLRYLQTAQFSLVRESLAEREWMIEHIPDLVKPNWFYIPVYKKTSVRPWKVAAGLLLYRILSSGFSKHSQFKRISKSQWGSLNGLNTEGLQAVFAYQDAQTDDQHLTQRIMESAESLGAQCMDKTSLISASKAEGGYQVCFKNNGSETNVKAKVIVNATGPWVNRTLDCFTPAVNLVDIELVQGTHIVIEERLSETCYYLEAPSDGRAVFALPWKGKTMIGTTENIYNGAPDDCEPLESEIDYLKDTLRFYFPDLAITVVESFSGLRVLPKAEGRAFHRPRDVQVKVDDALISVYGGKLTGWRHTAEVVLKAIEKKLGKHQSIDTRKLRV